MPPTIISQSPILTWLIAAPIFGAILIMFLPVAKTRIIRNTGLLFSLLTFGLAILAATMFKWSHPTADGTLQLVQTIRWIRVLSSHYSVGVDALSMPLIVLTSGLAVLACYAGEGIVKQVKGFHVLFLLEISLTLGVLAAQDLLAFFIFCQLAFVPLYFLIGLWGGAKKELAAGKFLICMLVSGVLMLVGILGVHSFAQRVHNIFDDTDQTVLADHPFDMPALTHDRELAGMFVPRSVLQQSYGIEAMKTSDGSEVTWAKVLFWVLFVGLVIVIPAAGVHTWLIDTLAEAPTPIAMLLSGVTLALGSYGLFRIVGPIFPYQVAQAWWWVALIGVVTIMYGALCALAQKDLKRLIAYASISQMGYVLLGFAVMTPAAAHGAVFMLIAHGINMALMFFIAGVIDDRAGHRDIDRLGGLATQMPGFSSFAAVGFFASMGIPGFCSFVAQLLIIYGTFSAAGIDPNESPLAQTAGHNTQFSLMVFAILAAASSILTVGYLLWALQRIFLGTPRPEHHHFTPLLRYERIILFVLCAATVALGIYPTPLLSRLPDFTQAATNHAATGRN